MYTAVIHMRNQFGNRLRTVRKCRNARCLDSGDLGHVGVKLRAENLHFIQS